MECLAILAASPYVLTQTSAPASLEKQIHQRGIGAFEMREDAMHELDELQGQGSDGSRALFGTLPIGSQPFIVLRYKAMARVDKFLQRSVDGTLREELSVDIGDETAKEPETMNTHTDRRL